jgi:dihydroorotase-like cyclic amidohydrolase
MREEVASTRLGLRGMPAAAESVCVSRDVQLVELTSAPALRASLRQGIALLIGPECRKF